MGSGLPGLGLASGKYHFMQDGLLLFIPASVLWAPPRRLHYCGAGWALPSPLVKTRVDSGMHVGVVLLCVCVV